MSLAVLEESKIKQIAQPWWTVWAGLHWGFRRYACVLWCASGRISPDRAYGVLGIDSIYPTDLVLFYRELLAELTPEKELAQMVVDVMPVKERKHLKKFFAGTQAFQAVRHQQSIAQLMNEVFVPEFLPRLRASHDSDDNRIADGRRFAEGLRRTRVMRSENPPSDQSKTPLIFISESCVELIKALPSLEYNEQDSIWEAAKTCFRECPSVAAGIPRHIKRQQFIDKGITPQQRYLNAIEFDRKHAQPRRIIKRR